MFRERELYFSDFEKNMFETDLLLDTYELGMMIDMTA